MATQKTTNVSEQTKNVKQKSREAARRGCPRISLSSLNDLLSILNYCNQLMRHWNMHYATFNVLIGFVREYNVSGKGCTASSIMRVMGKKGCNYRIMNDMLTNLVNKGLIEVIGKGYMNSNVYAPTAASLKILNATVSMMCAA